MTWPIRFGIVASKMLIEMTDNPWPVSLQVALQSDDKAHGGDPVADGPDKGNRSNALSHKPCRESDDPAGGGA